MLFRRKKPLSFWQKLRSALWPKSGWRRSLRYAWHRLARLEDSPHSIAAGVASGVAISFTPFIGFHLIGSWAIAWATRGNLIAAWIGTLVGNPWTFPFIWLVIYRIGAFLLGREPSASVEMLSLSNLIDHPAATVGPLLVPMALGGVPLAMLAWFISYRPLRSAIERYQHGRRYRLNVVRGQLARARAAVKGGDRSRGKANEA